MSARVFVTRVWSMSCGQIHIFLGENRKKQMMTLCKMISSIEYLLNKNLLNHQQQTTLLLILFFITISFFFFNCGAFFLVREMGRKERKRGDFLVTVEGYLPRLLR